MLSEICQYLLSYGLKIIEHVIMMRLKRCVVESLCAMLWKKLTMKENTGKVYVLYIANGFLHIMHRKR